VEHEPLPDVTHDGRRWSNADDDRVDLVSYDPRWPSLFDAEAVRIRAALSGMLDFALEHFGSTAIPGLPAKPIIDIMVIADAPSSWAGLVEPIQNIGYVFWADNPRRDRMFFVKGMPPFGERRTHHVPRSDARGRASLDPEDLVRYASLKEELAARYPTDRDAYTEGKAQFVDEVLRRASGG
jgi:GrpB-like predicted nucleotidyltransferase (UPF0157 family)